MADAERMYRQILEQEPDDFEALYRLGVIVHQRGEHTAGLAYIDAAATKAPDCAPAHNNRGVVLLETERLDEALASFDQALALQPGYAAALHNRAQVLYRLGRYDEALISCTEALAYKSDFAEAYDTHGRILVKLRRFEEALRSYDQALTLKPDHVDALNNRGLAFHDLQRFDEAIANYDLALAAKPDFAEALCNRGIALYESRRIDEAVAEYERAIALVPDLATAQMNVALCRLITGNMARGWKDYECRWETDNQRGEKRDFAQPTWRDDTDLSGKTILVHAEQGFGDTIQFSRYAPILAERGAKVVLEVQPELRRLLSQLHGADMVLARGDSLPRFDLHCPLLSVPRAVGTRLATIPAPPRLSAPRELIEHWDARLGERRRLRVGLVWCGNLAHKDDGKRSIGLPVLEPLLRLPIEVVSLQKNLSAEDQDFLTARNVPHYGADLTDFMDTAALSSVLDLVISVDTAVAHLACSLGLPTWILLSFVPDWRWLVYHGDPLDHERQRLVFFIPGWDILDQARAVGFRTVEIIAHSSRTNAIIGEEIATVFVLKAMA